MLKLSTFDTFKHIQSKASTELDDSRLRELQLVLNGILNDIVAVCDQYNIVYSLGGGTCLGSVRHQGFIPWDDDVDINFSRAEYSRFIPLFEKEMGHKYWIHTPEKTNNYALLFARIRLKNTILKTRDDFFNEECGAFVDVFIIENTFDNPVLRYLHGFGCTVFGMLLSCRKFWRDRKYLLDMAEGNSDATRVFKIKIALGFLLAWGSINFWTSAAIKWAALCKDGASQYVTIPAGRKRFFGELHCREDICETIFLPFENALRRNPKNYPVYLSRLYGDYMQLPSAENIEKHIFFGEIVI